MLCGLGPQRERRARSKTLKQHRWPIAVDMEPFFTSLMLFDNEPNTDDNKDDGDNHDDDIMITYVDWGARESGERGAKQQNKTPRAVAPSLARARASDAFPRLIMPHNFNLKTSCGIYGAPNLSTTPISIYCYHYRWGDCGDGV